MTATPIGARNEAPAPTPSATGRLPMIVEMVVIRMGRSLRGPAVRIASWRSTPSRRSWLVKSTSRMAFLVTSPKSMMIPIIDMMLMVWPAISSKPIAPAIESGRENMMVKGWTKLSKRLASTM